MTFAAEIAKRRTLRSTLVRINPGRFISTLLASEGGGVYALTMLGYDVSSLKRNGTALTAVTIDPPTVNDTYYFNQTTGRLAVKLATAPNSTTNVLICYYYLFYTSGDQTEYYRTPDTVSGSKVFWYPRLNGSQSEFRESLDGLEAGIVTIADSALSIENSDYDFEQYLTANDSFFNKECIIWQDINGQIRQVYNGYSFEISRSSNTVSIALSNQLSLLDQTAYMGDTASECFYFSGIKQPDFGKVIPLQLAERSWRNIAAILDFTGLDYDGTKKALGLEAICTSFNEVISTSTNRTWTLCRTIDAIPTQSFGSIVSVTAISGVHVNIVFSSLSNVNIGDTFKWTESSVVGYGIVTGVQSLTVSVQWRFGVGYLAPTTSSTIDARKSLGLILEESGTGNQYFPTNVRDFTISETATSGGNKTISVTFVNNFESLIGLPSTLASINYTLYYFVQSSGDFTHGAILQRMLNAAGIDTDATSFAAADLALTDKTSFSIPFISETDYGNYTTYVQALLKSTLGYIRNNPVLSQIEYKLISMPTGSVVRTYDEIMESLDYDVVYRDIVTEIIPYNDHSPMLGDIIPNNASTSNKSKFLHDTIKSEKFLHVLAPNSVGKIGRQTQLIEIKSNRTIEFRYNTETVDLDLNVGDGHDLTTADIPGSVSNSENFVIGFNKSEEKTTIISTDLLGL